MPFIYSTQSSCHVWKCFVLNQPWYDHVSKNWWHCAVIFFFFHFHLGNVGRGCMYVTTITTVFRLWFMRYGNNVTIYFIKSHSHSEINVLTWEIEWLTLKNVYTFPKFRVTTIIYERIAPPLSHRLSDPCSLDELWTTIDGIDHLLYTATATPQWIELPKGVPFTFQLVYDVFVWVLSWNEKNVKLIWIL